MSELNIGLVTDSHFSEFDNAIAAILKESNLSAVIHLGDTVSDRKASIKQQTKEIMQSILTFESIGIPIFWLPGNIEKYSAYKTAFSNLAKEIKNVRDVTNLDNKVEFYNNDFVFIPDSYFGIKTFELHHKMLQIAPMT